jgi:CRP-like cAMP-binding protein
MVYDVPIFAGVGEHEQHLLAGKLTVEYVNEGIVIEEGAVGDKLYVITKGTVLISKRYPSKGWVPINTLGPGDFFGEIAILRKIPRTARVSVLTPCTFLTINADDFLEIYQSFSAPSRDNIQIIIAKRLEQLRDMA